MPHIEFIMAANYYWRHGEKPEFLNKSAEEAFDKARPASRPPKPQPITTT